MPRARASRSATQRQTYTSPARPAGPPSAKLRTSVGRSCPRCSALSRRIAPHPRKVTEIDAVRRSPASTPSTTRRTTPAGSGRRRPLTETSLPLGDLELGGDPAAGTGISDALVVGAGHHPGELPLDPVEVP